MAIGGTLMAGEKFLQKLRTYVVGCAAVVASPEFAGSKELRASGLLLLTMLHFEGN